MILEFTIENILSFKDKVTFSMLADSTKGLENSIVTIDNKRILKTCAIYGSNASGKTNLFNALNEVINLLKTSNYNTIDELPITTFKLDKECKNKPSFFEIKFIINKIRYVYGFTLDKTRIYEEYLYYYPNNRESKIFDRTNITEYTFPQIDERILRDISKKNSPNKFFLATATNWNYKKTIDAYNFLTKDIKIFNDLTELRDTSVKLYIDNEKELKPFVLEFLKKADFDITDYKIVETALPNGLLNLIPSYMKNSIQLKEDAKVFTTLFKHSSTTQELSYEEESSGTKIIFSFIPFIFNAMNNKQIIIVDEIDKSLHPYLVEMLINMFNDTEINKSNTQLIFNTHDTNLLKLNILRRDEIWFTEKDSNGVTDLYPLSDFSVRKNENIEKGYMLGRYGAVPFIKNDFNLWKEE